MADYSPPHKPPYGPEIIGSQVEHEDWFSGTILEKSRTKKGDEQWMVHFDVDDEEWDLSLEVLRDVERCRAPDGIALKKKVEVKFKLSGTVSKMIAGSSSCAEVDFGEPYGKRQLDLAEAGILISQQQQPPSKRRRSSSTGAAANGCGGNRVGHYLDLMACGSPALCKKLRDMLFKKDGSLNKRIAGGAELGRISFTADLEKDFRCQLVIKKKSIVRQAMKILREAGILSAYEHIDVLNLLIGGKGNQDLHADMVWKEGKEKEFVQEMRKGPPTSVILSLHDEDIHQEVFLGVCTGEFDFDETGSQTVATLKHRGRKGESFEVDKDKTKEANKDKTKEAGPDTTTVIIAPYGCQFSGSFYHAGARNVTKGSTDEDLLDKLNNVLREPESDVMDLEDEDADRPAAREALLGNLCEFKGLSRLCRLHTSTFKNDTKKDVFDVEGTNLYSLEYFRHWTEKVHETRLARKWLVVLVAMILMSLLHLVRILKA